MGGWNRKQLPPEIISRLGKEPDYKLAAEIGVNKTTVADARRKLNIKPYSEQNPKQTGFNNGGFLMRWVKNDTSKKSSD